MRAWQKHPWQPRIPRLLEASIRTLGDDQTSADVFRAPERGNGAKYDPGGRLTLIPKLRIMSPKVEQRISMVPGAGATPQIAE